MFSLSVWRLWRNVSKNEKQTRSAGHRGRGAGRYLRFDISKGAALSPGRRCGSFSKVTSSFSDGHTFYFERRPFVTSQRAPKSLSATAGETRCCLHAIKAALSVFREMAALVVGGCHCADVLRPPSGGGLVEAWKQSDTLCFIKVN